MGIFFEIAPLWVHRDVDVDAGKRYFEDVFTTLPLGFQNSLAELKYGENFEPFTPPDNMFTNIANVGCKAPPS